MTRKRKYDYEQVKRDWEEGLPIKELMFKHGVETKSSITAMARRNDWDSSARTKHVHPLHRTKNKMTVDDVTEKMIEKGEDAIQLWQTELEKQRKFYRAASDISLMLVERYKAIVKDAKETDELIKIANSFSTMAKNQVHFLDAQRRTYSEEVTMSLKKLEAEKRNEAAKEHIKLSILEGLQEKRG